MPASKQPIKAIETEEKMVGGRGVGGKSGCLIRGWEKKRGTGKGETVAVIGKRSAC